MASAMIPNGVQQSAQITEAPMTDHREQNSSCPVTWEEEPRGFLTEWEATPLKPTEDAKMQRYRPEIGNQDYVGEAWAAMQADPIGDYVCHEEAAALIRAQAARIAELEALVAADFDMLDSTWKARAEAAEAALAEAEARAYARAVEDAAIICEALNDKRLSGASGDFIASLASQRIRSLAQKEAGE